MFPGKWEVKDCDPGRKKRILFNGEYIEYISYEWIEAIDEMERKDIEFVLDTTFNAIAEKLIGIEV
jgi:hypothetical protein